MSLIKNTIANYIGQAYTILIGIVIIPFYLQYLGASAFGLIGLFTLLQTWLRSFDLSLMPTFTREIAFRRDQFLGFSEIKQLLHSLEILFLIVAGAIVLGVMFSSHWLANHWLKAEALSTTEIASCITLMGVIIALRWFSDLYRAGIQGMEHQVWLNATNIFILSLQYLGGWVLLRYITQNPVYFFEYQLCISIIELWILGIQCYRLIPSTSNRFIFSWKVIKQILPFSTSLAYVGTLYLLLTQLDKLLLSHILSLSTYGYFSLVMMLSGAISLLSGPISQAILPKMTNLWSQQKEPELIKLYRNATQIMAVVVFSITGIIAMFPTELLYIWTGNHNAAIWGGPILFWYVLGNACVAICAFQFYLQYAHGNLRLHVIYNTLIAIIWIPLVIWVTFHYGAMGAAILWFVMGIISFCIWTPIIHRQYAPGIHYSWLFCDLFPVLLGTVLSLWVISKISWHFSLLNRLESLAALCYLGAIILIVNGFASSVCRHWILKVFKIRIL